eukprot:gene15417-17252_t
MDHYSNYLLPEFQHEGIVKDERDYNLKIEESLSKLQDVMNTLHQKDASVPLGLLEQCGILIRQHRSLHHHFSDELRLKIVNVFLSLYVNFPDKISVPDRGGILITLRLVLKKRWSRLPISLDWRPFWLELMTLIHREGREDTFCAVNVLYLQIESITLFLFHCRHYIDPLQEDPNHPNLLYRDNLINYSMKILSNIRVMTCVEGLLALFFCLRNDFIEFTTYLPKWLDLWSTIDFNHLWDFCWLFLLNRAAKHPIAGKEFPWTSLLPFLFTKSKYLLAILPHLQSDSFPKGFPSYYERLLRLWNNMDGKLTTKFTKLLFHAMMHEDQATVKLSQFYLTPPNLIADALKTCQANYPAARFPGLTEEVIEVKSTCLELCQFFQSIRTNLHPSNTQGNAVWIARLVEVYLRSITKRIGVAIAQTLSEDINQGKEIVQRGNKIDEITWNTYLYLQGIFFLIIVESTNSTNFLIQELNAISLTHLITLNPLFTTIITPFLLDSLEPKSISQPQRFLSALNAFGRSMRVMLFPSPYILQYLPTLLKHSLAGIDPSDAQKSLDALELFCVIFFWIPIDPKLTSSSSLKLAPIGAYGNLLLDDKRSDLVPNLTDSEFISQLETLTNYLTSEWIYEYLDRIFILIEGLDRGNTAKPHKLEVSELVFKIIYANAVIFQALVSAGDDYFLTVQEKVLQYILRTASPHVMKICGKMLVAIIANRPTLFAHIFPRIMDEEVTFHTASEEKLRSRLLLAGACCRQTLNEYSFPVLNLLKSQSTILNYDRKLIYHKDMKVRKAYCKFLKDMLRGLVGTFPIDLPTPMAQRSFALAGPNIPVKSGMIWNHPSAATIGFVVEVLKLFSHQIKEEIFLALETATSPFAADSTTSAKEGEKVSAKKCEEMISANLTVLLKMLRGTADLLGDVITVNGKPQLLYIITTGREFLYQQISEEDRFFLCSYRSEVFKFLHTIKEKLREIPESSPYFILYNHAVIAKLWMKVFKIALTRRVSYLKNPDNLITGHAFQKQLDNATLHRTIYDHLKRQTLIGQLPKEGRGENDIMNLKYWKFHDRVSNWIGIKTWLQHSIRCHLMAENSIEVLYTPRSSQYSIDDNGFLTGFKDIYALAAHEYDYIGSKATVLYAQLTFICRSKLLYEVLKHLLKYLDSPTINYYELLCVTEVIKTNGVFSRLAGLLDLKLILFQALPKLQSAIARITDLEKQETAMLSLSDLLIGYTTVWTHYKDELAQLHNGL